MQDFFLVLLNMAFLLIVFPWGPRKSYFILYFVIVLIEYGLIKNIGKHKMFYRASIAFPLVLLLTIKYFPTPIDSLYQGLHIQEQMTPFFGFIGISYMAFRLSYMAVELNNAAHLKTSFMKYMSFAFFAPTLQIGPISKYSTYLSSFKSRSNTSFLEAVSRILQGCIKYFFLATIMTQLHFNGLLLDKYHHPPIDLLISSIAYYLFLYFNFSGFCDVVIGGSALMGIRVDENFNSPFLARNIQDFWNRWHITLNTYMRDMVFTPLTKFLIYRLGTRLMPLALTITIFIVFVIIGAWHGSGLNYIYFGLMHGCGVVVNYFWGLFLKTWLGGKRFKQYNKSSLICWISRILTFLFISLSFVVFAHDLEQIKIIFETIKF